MEILDKHRLDMNLLESKSFLETLRIFGYMELFRSKIGFSKGMENPDTIMMVLLD